MERCAADLESQHSLPAADSGYDSDGRDASDATVSDIHAEQKDQNNSGGDAEQKQQYGATDETDGSAILNPSECMAILNPSELVIEG